MSATKNSIDDGLLVSHMHKIGLSTDESSKVRLLLASQSPRRREILVSPKTARIIVALIIIFNFSCTVMHSIPLIGYDGISRKIYGRAVSFR